MREQHGFVRLLLFAAVLIASAPQSLGFNSIPTNDASEDDSGDYYGGNSNSNNSAGGGGGTATGTGTTAKIPFVGDIHHDYQDPFAKGFEITTRVYTDPHDKLAHFDDTFAEENEGGGGEGSTHRSSGAKPIVLPYWECGVAGSTTVPVPLSSMTVRHLLGGSKPGSFENGCGRGETLAGGTDHHDTTHPRLVVPLTPLEIHLNSGQARTFVPGDVILLENCLTGGHLLKGHEGNDMVVLLLTLPHPYHHVGRDRTYFSTIFPSGFWKENPCTTGLQKLPRRGDPARWSASYRLRRRLGLGIIGAGVSLALADFLGKVAPLALALAAGGGLVTVGGTVGLVKLGEYGLDELEYWHERRQLRLREAPEDGPGDEDKPDDDEDDVGRF
mmetsp:Transcript_23946/g.56568  ORF Transcript_23946/g.56568 Transcript_23946/m.56568 type:complete len:386 (-) Transcript_23946:541-1698(-)